MSIVFSKQKLLLIGIIVLTLLLAGAAVTTVFLLQSRTTVSPTTSKAATTAECTALATNIAQGNSQCTGNQKVCSSNSSIVCGDASDPAAGLCPAGDSCVWKSDHTWCDNLQSWKDQYAAQCTTTTTTNPVGTCADPNYDGKISYFGTNGGGIKILNCLKDSFGNYISNAVSCTAKTFHCDSATGDPGKTGQCSANQQSLPNINQTVAANSETLIGIPACSVGSCGSCQSDIVCGTAQDGKFTPGTTSCSTTTTTTTPITQTTSVTVTTTVPFTTTAIPGTRTPQDSPTLTPTATPSVTPSETPIAGVTTVVPTTTAVPAVLPNTGLFEDLILPTLIAIAFIVVGGVLANKQFKK